MHKIWLVPELVRTILEDFELKRADWRRICLVSRLFWEYGVRLLWDRPFSGPYLASKGLAVVKFLRQLAIADPLDTTNLPRKVCDEFESQR